MRIKHPERYHSYSDINKLSRTGNIIWLLILVVIVVGLTGGFAYHELQERERANQIELNNMQHLTNSVANLDTETDAIDYLKNSAQPVARYQIGSPTVLKQSLPSYSKELTGYNYPLVDYFQINNSNYYLRLIYTSNTKEKFQTMLLEQKEYQLYSQFDNLQEKLAKTIKPNNYDRNALTELRQFKKQHSELHN